jgi:dolichol-phosphate hexosyltransferase
MKTVGIIIPALNEEETIGRVIDEVPVAELNKEGFVVQVVVVDNNCTDGTARIAREKGITVIFESQKGKGHAIRSAFEQVKADYIFMIDADYTYPATYIPQMLSLLQNDYAVVVGSRLTGTREKGAMNQINFVGNHLLTFMANTLYRMNITDLCSGFWGFRSEVVRKLNFTANGFELEANLFTIIARSSLSIGQVPIYYRCRPTKQKLVPLKDGFKIGWKLITARFSGK